MTIIAYDGHTLATDSGQFAGNLIAGRVNKIHHLFDGSVFSAAGGAADIMAVVNWLEGTAEKPKIENSFCGIQIMKDGKLLEWDDTLVAYECALPFVAGSGQEVALTAMHLGLDAETAVRAACELCTHCVEPIQTWSK